MTTPTPRASRASSDAGRLLALAIVLFLIALAAWAVASGGPPQSPAALGAGASPSTSPDGSAKPERRDLGDRDRLGDRGTFGGPGRGITITKVEGSSISLRTDDGWTRTIALTADTVIRKAGTTIAAGDLAVGDQIHFRQRRAADGTYAILAIEVVVPRLTGAVTAIDASSLTLKLRDGSTRKVALTAATTYVVGRGPTEAKRTDVAVGNRVRVAGENGPNDSFTALTVTVILEQVGGEVTAKTADSLTLRTRRGGTVIVHLDGETTFRVRGVATAGAVDIAIGMRVEATGLARPDGSLDAVSVQARQPRVGARPNASASPTGG